MNESPRLEMLRSELGAPCACALRLGPRATEAEAEADGSATTETSQMQSCKVVQSNAKYTLFISFLSFPFSIPPFLLFYFFTSSISTTFSLFTHSTSCAKRSPFHHGDPNAALIPIAHSAVSSAHQYCESSWLQRKNYCKASNRKKAKNMT